MLRAEIQEIFKEHIGRYGSLRITKVLEKKGIKVNRKRVGKLMRQMNLYAKEVGIAINVIIKNHLL